MLLIRFLICIILFIPLVNIAQVKKAAVVGKKGYYGTTYPRPNGTVNGRFWISGIRTASPFQEFLTSFLEDEREELLPQNEILSSGPYEVGNQMYFISSLIDPRTGIGQSSLYVSDGTKIGTKKIPINSAWLGNTANLISFNSDLLLPVSEGKFQKLFAINPEKIQEVFTLETNGIPFSLKTQINFGKLLISVVDKNNGSNYLLESYVLDSLYNTVQKNNAAEAKNKSKLFETTALPFGDYFYFNGEDAIHGGELFRIHKDSLVSKFYFEFSPGLDSNYQNLQRSTNIQIYKKGEDLKIIANNTDSSFEYELKSSWNKPAFVRKFFFNLGSAFFLGSIGSKDFYIFEEDNGEEIYTLNEGQTKLVLLDDIWKGPYSSIRTRFDQKSTGIIMGEKMVFFANDGLNGAGYWKTDGTIQGTKRCRNLSKDIFTGTIDFYSVVGNIFYALAVNQKEEWAVYYYKDELEFEEKSSNTSIGKEEWFQTIGNQAQISQTLLLKNGDYLIYGHQQNGLHFGEQNLRVKNEGYRHTGFVSRIAPTGEVLFSRTFPLTIDLMQNAIYETAEGKIILVGLFSRRNDTLADKVLENNNFGNSPSVFLASFSIDLNLEWVKTFNAGFEPESIIGDPSGNIFLTAVLIDGGEIDFGNNVSVQGNSYSRFLLKLDSKGNAIWVKKLFPPAGENGGHTVETTIDPFGRLIILETEDVSGTSDNFKNSWIKISSYDARGEEVWQVSGKSENAIKALGFCINASGLIVVSGNYFLKMELSTGEKLSYPCKKDCYQKPFLIQISSKTGHVVLASTIKDQSLAIGQIRFFGEDKLIAVFTGFSKYNPNYWEPPKDSAGIGILNLFGQTEKVYSLKYNALTTISFSSNLTIDPMGFLLFSGNNFLSFNDKPNLPYYTGVAVLARIKIDDENFKPADPIQSSGNTGPFFAFPNPSSQSFWLKSAEPGRKPEKIFLFTISGKRKELAFREEEGQFQLINLPDLKSGLYFIEILSKGELFKIRQIILNK